MAKPLMYARLSHSAGALQTQMRELFDLACRTGCEIVATLAEDTQDQEHGPGSRLEEAVQAIPKAGVSLISAWTVDGLGRSSQHVVIKPVNESLRDVG